VTKLAAVEKDAAPPATTAAHYETLRRAALGGVLPPEARSGLIVFLWRGFWGWTRAVAGASARPAPIPAASSRPTEPGKQSAIVHLFAAMAIQAKDRRAP
jgi:hypothetical protein